VSHLRTGLSLTTFARYHRRATAPTATLEPRAGGRNASTMSAMPLPVQPNTAVLSSSAEWFSGQRVVVTGGAGFIGSHLVDALATVAGRVVVIDDLSTGSISNLSAALSSSTVEFVHGSILDSALLGTVIAAHDTVFHFAAIPSVTRSLQDPLASDLVNVHGTLSVLKAATAANAAHVVFASSSSVYGDSTLLPRLETAIPQPISPYAVSKLTGEHYCQVFVDQFGLSTTVVRFFNVYGPRQSPHSQYSAVVPLFIDAALDSRPLTIYGDGQQTRDFTYVEDVVRACLVLAARQSGGVFNVAASSTISVNYLAERVLRATASTAPIRHLAERPGDIRDSAADIGKLRALGYKPQHSIEGGLEKTVKWTRKADHRMRPSRQSAM